MMNTKENLATARPVFVKHNVCFLVDSSVVDWEDLKSEQSFNRTKTKPPYGFKKLMGGSLKTCQKDEIPDLLVWRYLYNFTGNSSFHKVIVKGSWGNSGDDIPVVFVQYYFDGEPSEVYF